MSVTPPEAVPRVRRDSWTRLLYLQLGAFAFFLYAFNPSIDLLKDDLHVSAGVAGLHSTCYAVGVTLGSAGAPWYIRRAGGFRPALWWALVGLSLSVGLFCAVPALPVTLPAAAVCGVFGSLLCIAVPAALARAHGPETGPAAITEANAVAAFVGIAAPLAVGGAAAAGLGWRTALLSVAPLSALLYAALGRVREPERSAADGPDAEGPPVAIAEAVEAYGFGVVDTGSAEAPAVGTGAGHGTLASSASDLLLSENDSGPISESEVLAFVAGTASSASSTSSGSVRDLSRRFWINQVAGVCAGAIEFCLTLWCATLLRDRAHLSAGVATTGVTAVVAGMAIGRAAGGRLALRLPIDTLILGALATNLAGFALFWAATNPVLMFVGLAVAGLGLSLLFPLTSARGIEMAGGRAELAGAVNMVGSGLAAGTAPFALGFLSDQVGIHTAYLLLPGFIVVAALAVVGSRPRGPSEL